MHIVVCAHWNQRYSNTQLRSHTDILPEVSLSTLSDFHKKGPTENVGFVSFILHMHCLGLLICVMHDEV